MAYSAYKRTAASMVFLLCAFAALAAEPLTHTLQKGETLYSISRKYSVPYEALAAANGISDPTKLQIGTVILIPSVHVVEKGETLYGLSRRYGITVDQLLAANKLGKSYVLKVGDVLVIPGAAAQESAPAIATATTVTVPEPPKPQAGYQSATTTLAPPAVVIAPTPTTAAPAPTPSTTSPSTTTSTQMPQAAALPTTTVKAAPASTTTVPAAQPSSPSTPQAVPMPEPLKTADKAVDMTIAWPAEGKAMYLDGKLEGVMIRSSSGKNAKAVASGTVVSAGPSRGFNQVVFVQAKSGYVYVYGGCDSLFVKTGDQVSSGKELGRIGIDAKDGTPIAYFFVFRNGQPIDPALAPRE